MKITEAESQVMEALWRQSPLSAEEVLADVKARQPWGDATVKTLINRLLKKKALASERTDGRHRYRALLTREAYLQTESQGLLDRLFDGQLAPMVAHFAEQRRLSPEEITRLKALIDQLGDD